MATGRGQAGRVPGSKTGDQRAVIIAGRDHFHFRALLLFCAVVPLATGGCEPTSNAERNNAAALSPAVRLTDLSVAASPGAMAPNLASSSAGPIVSWLEPDAAGDGHRLRVSRWLAADRAFGTPATVAEGKDFFANWADFPSVVQDPDGSLTAHWLRRTGEDTYAYGVALAHSDNGREWRPEGWLHEDRSPTEHGFVSWVPNAQPTRDGASQEGLLAFWLDGREMARPDGPMTLRARFLTEGGGDVSSSETVLDDRVCECCQTDAAMTADGPIVVYRNRSEEEIRDIWRVRLVTGSGGQSSSGETSAWSKPAAIHEDGWQIAGCPVNGPAVAADGTRVAVAWFTAADDQPRVQLAISTDSGDTFGSLQVVDADRPTGRVDVAVQGTRIWVSWLGRSAEGASLLLREVEMGDSGRTVEIGDLRTVEIAAASVARSAGFPRMLLDRDRLLFAWVETGQPSRIRVAEMPVGRP